MRRLPFVSVNVKSKCLLLIVALLCMATLLADAQVPSFWGDWPNWGDRGDGTYNNLVLPGDYSDLDCIRVGSDYYAITSTFQYSPGVAILHSKDLVNWSIVGHAVSDVTQIASRFNWSSMNGYARGVWAGAIRYHDGKFWVYFGTPDEGYFMTTATDVAGPWEPLHRMLAQSGWDDCCPFWDDDGQGYFIGTHFSDGYKIWLYKLTPDGRDLVAGSEVLINQGSGREANKLFKVGDTYYHFYSESANGTRYVMMERSKNIAGPYTEKQQLSAAQKEWHEPNQGGIVQTEAGDWYFLTHHGDMDWEGRPASLLPVTWVNGWPILGDVGSDGLGRMVWSGTKPVQGQPVAHPQSSDDFSGPNLGLQWEWNFQPRADMWSLTERPGYLRLHAFKPLTADALKKAGNTLTQRSMRTPYNVATVALDLSGMADGQVAGLCHYGANTSTIDVRRTSGVVTLETSLNGAFTSGPQITSTRLWLRSTWAADGLSRYAYSTDGQNFTSFGAAYQLVSGDYRGDRLGIFTYNNDAEAGTIDCDSFTYDYDQPAPPVPPVSRVVSLVHRYSFSETSGATVADSVGGSAWNGTLPNGGTLGGGQVQLRAASSQYVKLPAGILSDYTAVTIDAWVTFPSALPTNCFFFGFGNISGTSGSSYIFCQPRTGRLAITPSNFSGEQSTTPNPSGNWSNQTNLHVTAVFDPPQARMALYVNGVLKAQSTGVTTTLGAINNMFSYIGRSLYSGDSYFDFNLDEFRIYKGAFNQQDVDATQSLGPDQLVAPPAAPGNVNASASGASIQISWSDVPEATGYTIKRSTSAGGTFTLVASGLTTTSYTDSPMADGTTYYYVVTGANSGGEGSASSTASTTLYSDYQQWKIASGLDVNIADNATSGSGGAPVLLKYAIGAAPGAVVNTPFTTMTTPTRGISFTRLSPARAKFVVQASSDLAAWTDIATLAYGSDTWTGPATVDEDTTVTPRKVTVHDDPAFDSAAKRFFRVQVQRNVP
jgi:beta-xylosidase